MNYLQNHIWCSESNWGNNFDCRHLVSLNSYSKSDVDDWKSIIRMTRTEDGTDVYPRRVPELLPEVMDWLNTHVPDLKKDINGHGHLKSWCIGSTNYNTADPSSFTIFFSRRRDAMAFIKRWSKWKKPTHYCQYFTDVRKELNLSTLKYINK